MLRELRASRRRDKLAAFTVGDEEYQLLLLPKATVADGSGLCTGHVLRCVPGASSTYYAEAATTTLPAWSHDCICTRANVISDVQIETDAAPIQGQLDLRRIHVPPAFHALLLNEARTHVSDGVVS